MAQNPRLKRAKPRKGLVALFIALLVTLSTGGGQARAADSPSFKSSGLSGMGGGKVRKLLVPSFTVNFLTRANGVADSGKGFLASRRVTASAGMYIDWHNPDLTMLQAITDEAYAAFERHMNSAGVELLPRSKFLESDAFKAINGQFEPDVEEVMVHVAPTGMKLYDPAAKIDPKGGFMLGMANLNSKLETDAAKALAGSLDDVAIARVALNVTYGTFDSIAYSFTTLDTASATANIKFAPVLTIPTTSGTMKYALTGATLSTAFDSTRLPNGIEFAVPKRNGFLELKAPVSGKTDVASLANSTSKGEKVAVAAANLLGTLASISGSRGFHTSAERYEATILPEPFKSEANAALDKVTGELVSSIRSALQ